MTNNTFQRTFLSPFFSSEEAMTAETIPRTTTELSSQRHSSSADGPSPPQVKATLASPRKNHHQILLGLSGILFLATTDGFAPVVKVQRRQRLLAPPHLEEAPLLTTLESPAVVDKLSLPLLILDHPAVVTATATTTTTQLKPRPLPKSPADALSLTKPSFLKKQELQDFHFGCLVEESTRRRAHRASPIIEEDGPEIAPRSTSPMPRINSAPTFGLRPGSPAQFLVATAGERPMRFSISDGVLPTGLRLDEKNGVIYGQTRERGAFPVTLVATNRAGVATRPLTIKVGDTLALTPPRGISTWNSCGDRISSQKIRDIAAAAVQLGLRDHGYTYINMDDGWQGTRKADGTMQPNEKFHDLPELFSDLHALGFHCGIYGTPWKHSYCHYPGGSADPPLSSLSQKPPFFLPNVLGWRVGQIRYEEQDAAYFASLGADFLKWDWYRNDLASTRRMSEALRQQPRDIVYSLSNSAPLKNAKRYKDLCHMVRTTPDIRDAWDKHSPRDPYCLSIKEIWRAHEPWAKYQSPGFWVDPDMLVVGPVGWGCLDPRNFLTRDEQLTHMTLWVLWSSPLIVGCDLEHIDDKTLDMLCNRGALSINEDTLGLHGKTVSQRGDATVVVKKLANGDIAVGLFNTGRGKRNVSVTWKELGLDKSAHNVYDVWADRDLGAKDGLNWDVREHSAKLFRISPLNKAATK
jgi:alpha-galactosidase